MNGAAADQRVTRPAVAEGFVGRIPVRNLWLLMLYASELFRAKGTGAVGLEDSPDELPDLVAEILAHAVERRLRRHLSFGYQRRDAVLSRVRGRIDVLKTERHQLLARGLVACRYDELTVDTRRNQLVRAALESISRTVRRRDLAHRCRSLASGMKAMGVSGYAPAPALLEAERFGRHDVHDRFMVEAAKLALDLTLPTEASGASFLALPDREEAWVRQLFEKAVGGFYEVVLKQRGWQVRCGRMLRWQIHRKTSGIDKILPTMKTDVELNHLESQQRIVIDTKFTSIFTPSRYREETLRSAYIYQIYAYLRSQVGSGDPLAETASGLLLHPSLGVMVDETVSIQGHAIRFATVDLAAPASEIRAQLIRLCETGAAGSPG